MLKALADANPHVIAIASSGTTLATLPNALPTILLPTALSEITRTTPAKNTRSSMGKACKLCGLVALQ